MTGIGADGPPELVASHMTLSGSGFTDPARYDFATRADAAVAAGFHGIGIQFADLDANGGTAVQCDIARLAGIDVVEAEFLGGWVSAESPEAVGEHERAAVAAARAWGVRHVTAGEWGAGPLDLVSASRNLAALAGRLEPYGVKVAIEPFGWGAIGDYPTALELIRASGAPNAGLMIDVWHFFNTGVDIGWLGEVDGDEIVGVQLNDGPRLERPTTILPHELRELARTTRWLPGVGELPVRELVAAMTERGFRGPYSVEVNNPEFRSLPIAEAAEAAFASASRVLPDQGH